MAKRKKKAEALRRSSVEIIKDHFERSIEDSYSTAVNYILYTVMTSGDKEFRGIVEECAAKWQERILDPDFMADLADCGLSGVSSTLVALMNKHSDGGN